MELETERHRHNGRTYGICNASAPTIPSVPTVAQSAEIPELCARGRRQNAWRWAYTRTEEVSNVGFTLSRLTWCSPSISARRTTITYAGEGARICRRLEGAGCRIAPWARDVQRYRMPYVECIGSPIAHKEEGLNARRARQSKRDTHAKASMGRAATPSRGNAARRRVERGRRRLLHGRGCRSMRVANDELLSGLTAESRLRWT